MAQLTDDELIDLFTRQLPNLLDERPELEPQLYYVFLKTFARKEEVAAVAHELAEFRQETRESFARVDQRFEQLDRRFEQVDRRAESLEAEMRRGFDNLTRQIDRLGTRWGIRNESLFRATITSLLEESFGAKVATRFIEGEQFDLIITNGCHILVEITASASPRMQKRLERKRELYAKTTGVQPARFILAVASIHSQRAQALRDAGFEVIEPEESEDE